MAEDVSEKDNTSSDGRVKVVLAGYVQQLFEHIVISEGKDQFIKINSIHRGRFTLSWLHLHQMYSKKIIA